MYGILFSKWRIAFGCLAGRKRACSSRSFSLSPLTEYQAREEKEDEEEEILAVLLSSSPSLPCSILPGSAGRQMTRVCGRLITPGWVFSNLFNGSLLKKKTRWRRRRGGRRRNTGGRQVSRPSGQGSQPSQGRTSEEEEDAPTPLVEIPKKIKRHRRRRRERKGEKKHKKHNAHY